MNNARIIALTAAATIATACGAPADAPDADAPSAASYEADAAAPAARRAVCFEQAEDLGCRTMPSDEDAMVHVMDARTGALMEDAIVRIVTARMADERDGDSADERSDEGGPELSIEATGGDADADVEVEVRADGHDCWIARVAPRGTVTISCRPAADAQAQSPSSAPREGDGMPQRTW